MALVKTINDRLSLLSVVDIFVQSPKPKAYP